MAREDVRWKLAEIAARLADNPESTENARPLLEGVRGDLDADELDAYHQLWHWVIDEDIRSRDEEYAVAQRASLQRLARKLRG